MLTLIKQIIGLSRAPSIDNLLKEYTASQMSRLPYPTFSVSHLHAPPQNSNFPASIPYQVRRGTTKPPELNFPTNPVLSTPPKPKRRIRVDVFFINYFDYGCFLR